MSVVAKFLFQSKSRIRITAQFKRNTMERRIYCDFWMRTKNNNVSNMRYICAIANSTICIPMRNEERVCVSVKQQKKNVPKSNRKTSQNVYKFKIETKRKKLLTFFIRRHCIHVNVRFETDISIILNDKIWMMFRTVVKRMDAIYFS